MGIELESGKVGEDGWVRGAIIGAGASGTVSLAMSRCNGQLFAVKSAGSSSVALDNEYRILQGMDSPYIVACLGHCYSVENCVKVQNLFMEYMPGGSIGDLLIKFGGQLDESVIRAYTRGILRGMDYLHRQGIVHCDIKAKNVLVGANGVKLADFGSAKRISDENNGQETLQLRGTPQWMAPEVVNQVEQGPASDIWSLGCTVLEMATGRPPWSQVSNPLAAMYRIGCTEELPELPSSLSPQIRDFLEKCIRRDPKKRWTCVELLKHPFLNEDCSAMEAEEAIRDLGSPTSHLDFRNQVWDSYSCQTIPILSLSISCPTEECNRMVDSNKSVEQRQRPSPRDRVMALATDCEFEIADSPNWYASPPGQWIVVRSPRDKSPTLDNPLLKSDISNASSIQELPFTKEECSANLEAVNWEEVPPRGVVDECLDSALYIPQTQQESSSSIYSQTLQQDLLLWSVTAHLTDQTWEFYGYSSQSTADSDPVIHNRSVLGKTFYMFGDKRASTAKAGACCPCCNVCSTECCHKIMIKGQLYIGCREDKYSCCFASKLIPIEITWLHT